MAEILQIDRDLSEPYSFVNAFRNKGNAGCCGHGVRDRPNSTDLAKTYFSTAYPAACGISITHFRFRVSTVVAVWGGITDGSFRITIDGAPYNIDGIDFTGVANMDGVAAVIQKAVRDETGSTETVVWDTDHFVITTVAGDDNSITVLETSTGTVGTDISGAGASDWMDGDTGNGEVTHYLTGGSGAESAFATWAAVTDGSFRVTIDGTGYNVDAINFTGDASMDDVAATIASALQTATGGTERVTWVTDHFLFRTDAGETITVLETSTGTVGTDISGAGASDWTDADSGNGLVSAFLTGGTDAEDNAPCPDLKVGIWSYTRGASSYQLVGHESVSAPTGNWQADTEYYYALVDSIFLQCSLNTYFYLAFYTDGFTFDCSDDQATVRAAVYDGDAFALPTVSIPDDYSRAISFEAWGEPAGWAQDLEGGALVAVTEDWFGTEEGDFTGTLSDIEASAGSITAAGNGTYVAVDLADGQIATGHYNADSDTFPDYSTMGIRAVAEVRVKGNMPAVGELAVLINTTDSTTLPTTGWENLGSIDNSGAGAYDETFDIPVVARWIKIVEVSDTVTNTITQLIVKIATEAVTDGDFPVNHAQDPHGAWVSSSPDADTVWKCRLKNSSGGIGAFSAMRTNRKYRD